MDEHNDVAYERLLTIWGFHREMFNRYSRALGMLMMDGVAPQQRREMSEKLAQTERAFREASERLRFYEIAAS